jgi:putative Holliday junction resolvase
MRVLGIDVGERRVGVALSDPTGMIAQSLTVIPRRSWAQVTGAVGSLAREHHVERVVVGLPLRLDGREGEAALSARRFADRLRKAVSVPVVLEDERLTTTEAERVMLAADESRSARRARRDAVAAALILQRHLDRERTDGRRSGDEIGGDADDQPW